MSIHKEFLDRCNSKINIKDKKVLEIGCGDGKDLMYMLNTYHPSEIIGIDKYLDSWWSTSISEGEGWRIESGDSENLAFADESFDLVYSLATFEHIHDLRQTFKEIKRVLKPGGKFYTDYSGIWTSIIGHHYNFWMDIEKCRLIPPWGHLWMEREQLFDYISQNSNEKEAFKACSFIYDSLLINRHPLKMYVDCIMESGFWIRELNEKICFNRASLFGQKDNELSDDILARLSSSYSYSDLCVMGHSLLLEKYY